MSAQQPIPPQSSPLQPRGPGVRLPASRLAGMAFVILLHIAMIYVLASGLGQQVVELVQAPIMARIIEDATPPPEQPPPPPQLAPPPVPYIPPPEIHLNLPPPPKAITALGHEPRPAPPHPAAPLREAVRVPAEINASACRKPPYPPAAKRLQEQGTVMLKFRIGTDGKVITGLVQSSSGHQRLDQAALDALSLCRFVPGTVDGVPEESWAMVNYVWRLETQPY